MEDFCLRQSALLFPQSDSLSDRSTTLPGRLFASSLGLRVQPAKFSVFAVKKTGDLQCARSTNLPMLLALPSQPLPRLPLGCVDRATTLRS